MNSVGATKVSLIERAWTKLREFKGISNAFLD